MDCIKAQQLIASYIQKDLNGRELEAFLEHISECKECHEELEIYFTIHFALQQLDDDTHVTYNVQQLLVEDLHNTRAGVNRKKKLNIAGFLLAAVAELAIILALVTQIQIWSAGNLELTGMYQFRHRSELPIEEVNVEETADLPEVSVPGTGQERNVNTWETDSLNERDLYEI